MNYLKYTFVASEDLKDELIAQVGEFPFDTFEDTENGFSAYIPEKEITSEIDTAIQLLSMSYGVTFEKEVILGQNWNEVWESNFQPILIDDFCAIRAEFHPHYPEFPIELTIAPKMAFGTGHHETTYMMIQGMKSLDLKNKKVYSATLDTLTYMNIDMLEKLPNFESINANLRLLLDQE